MSYRAVSSCALLALLLALVGPGCVRLDEPDAFVCNYDGDCLAGERCGLNGRCLAPDRCDVADDCAATEACYETWCVTAQCTPGSEAACGAFRCHPSERICFTSCSYSGECMAGFLCDGADECVPAATLANGSVCTVNEECASRACCTIAGTRVCSVC
jgi:hypothetical protein